MADNIIIGNRIKQAREDKGLTQEELGKLLGMNKSTVQRYETAKIEKIKLPVIEAMAQILDVNPEWLSDKSTLRTKYNTNIISYTPENMVPIPVIGTVAAGYTSLAETDIECYELVSPEVLNDGYEYVYLKVVGDSMEPLLIEGDKVLVRIQSSVESGDYAVVIVDEEDGIVKKYVRENDTVTLISENPYYPPRPFKGKQAERVRIFGKVVESKRSFM